MDLYSDDGSDAPRTSTLSSRAIATEWAQNVLRANTNRVKTADRPYVEAVLIAAAMYEQPIKELVVGFNDSGDDKLKISIKGYKALMNDRIWVNTFLGKHRDELLDNVTDTFTQLTDMGVIKVIHMDKVVFLRARDAEYDDGGGSARAHHHGGEAAPVTTASARRIRKRA